MLKLDSSDDGIVGDRFKFWAGDSDQILIDLDSLVGFKIVTYFYQP